MEKPNPIRLHCFHKIEGKQHWLVHEKQDKLGLSKADRKAPILHIYPRWVEGSLFSLSEDCQNLYKSQSVKRKVHQKGNKPK